MGTTKPIDPAGTPPPQTNASVGAASGPRLVLLTPEEIEVLLRCCIKYRSSIPAYLQSARAEFEAMNAIVGKLQASASGGDDDPAR